MPENALTEHESFLRIGCDSGTDSSHAWRSLSLGPWSYPEAVHAARVSCAISRSGSFSALDLPKAFCLFSFLVMIIHITCFELLTFSFIEHHTTCGMAFSEDVINLHSFKPQSDNASSTSSVRNGPRIPGYVARLFENDLLDRKLKRHHITCQYPETVLVGSEY